MDRRYRSELGDDFTDQFAALNRDDDFLTALSEGLDPSDGTDELAALLLELRDDVSAPMPKAPVIGDEDSTVIPLDSRRRSRPLFHGLVGAAAATVLIAGSGAVLVGTGVIGAQHNDPTVVELAGTLDELQSRAAEGDISGTQALLDEAQRLVAKLDSAKDNSKDPAEATPAPGVRGRETATVTETPGQVPGPAGAPVTVTAPGATVTESSVVTETTRATETQVVTVTETRAGSVPTAPATTDAEPVVEDEAEN